MVDNFNDFPFMLSMPVMSEAEGSKHGKPFFSEIKLV